MQELTKMKSVDEPNLQITAELLAAEAALTVIWQRVLPLSKDRAYCIDDKTLSVLTTAEIEKISDEYLIDQIL